MVSCCGCFSNNNPKDTIMMRIGVLCIDYNYEPILGDVDCTNTFEHEMIYEKVSGLTFEKAQLGHLDDEITSNLKIAIRKLELSGCVGITGNCGFMMYYQIHIRRMTNLPVFMSSLIQAPMLEAIFQREEKIMIITSNESSLTRSIQHLLHNCGITVHDISRFIVVGVDHLPSFKGISTGERLNYDACNRELKTYIHQKMIKHQNVKCFLFECTELPAYGDSIRQFINLPVFDAVTMINYYFTSMSDNELIGIKKWY